MDVLATFLISNLTQSELVSGLIVGQQFLALAGGDDLSNIGHKIERSKLGGCREFSYFDLKNQIASVNQSNFIRFCPTNPQIFH